MVVCNLDREMKSLVRTVMAMYLPVAEVRDLDLAAVTQSQLEALGKDVSDLVLSVGDKCRTMVVQLEEDSFNSVHFNVNVTLSQSG